ncbi:hypothetical protein BDN67DRAFT_969989 [Paxillus ammoniavirescens]|nr:hypothetical protein BDN67DRAFT_969989 [Paxillus ammoniavirescens]
MDRSLPRRVVQIKWRRPWRHTYWITIDFAVCKEHLDSLSYIDGSRGFSERFLCNVGKLWTSYGVVHARGNSPRPLLPLSGVVQLTSPSRDAHPLSTGFITKNGEAPQSCRQTCTIGAVYNGEKQYIYHIMEIR